MKCIFPHQTRDSVERLWSEQILKHFPRYGEFWQEFIGVRIDPKGGYLQSYELDLSKIAAPKRDEVKRINELLCMTHYSCFCHLAGAHQVHSELIDALRNPDPEARHFKHWQAFEAGYLHLGAAWQEMKALWECVLAKLTNLNESREESGAIWRFFSGHGYAITKGNIDKMQKEVIDFRNDVAHYARSATQLTGGKYTVPKDNPGPTVWSQQLIIKDWEDTATKLEKAILMCEEVFNETHSHLSSYLNTVLKNHSISVDHSSGHVDVTCQLCGWWSAPIAADGSTLDSRNMPASGSAGSSVLNVAVSDPAASGLVPMTSPPTSISSNQIYRCTNRKCRYEFSK